MIALRRCRRAALLLAAFAAVFAGCTQHAVIQEIRVYPNLLCPCDPLRAEVVVNWSRQVEVTLTPPGTTQTTATTAQAAPTVVTELFAEVCEPAIVSAVAVLADPETVPATSAVNVPVLLGPEAIPAVSAPICGESCTISGYQPIGFSSNRFSESIQVLEVCNRSGRRVELTSPGGTFAELAPAGCTSVFSGARLVGTWPVRAQPRIGLSVREVCPDPACVTGELGPLPGVEAGIPLALDFLVGCPPA